MSDSVCSALREFLYSSLLSSLRRIVSVSACASDSVSISLYVVLCIGNLQGCFGGHSSAVVAFGGVGGKRDGCSFGSMLGEPLDWGCCVPHLELAELMPSVPTWLLRPIRFPTWGVGWLCELACGCLDMAEC